MAKEKTKDEEKSDKPPIYVVRVRATQRGFDGFVIRNDGDVFEMDVLNMKKLTDTYAPPAGTETVKTPIGEFALPSWCEKASKREPLVSAGHTTTFGKETQDRRESRNDDVI